MIKEKGKRYGRDVNIAENSVVGNVDKILTTNVPVDSDKIFDSGTFDDERQVILVEGLGGMGKTSLSYQYAKKWAEGKLSTFDAVALVRLRDLNEHYVHEVDHILPHLLLLASGDNISNETARRLVENQRVLIVLDGWDESPASICKSSFLKDLLRSVSPQTRILITSRPDFSLDLHGLANRVKIIGFTKGDIHNYFENALKSHLPNSEVKSACDKLNSHFHRYPVIESCCYVPLNAAILAYIYLYRDQTLPVTQCELFKELVLCCIVRELQSRQPDRVLEDVSSFEDLPADLKDRLYKLSKVAFDGVRQNKIVFTQKELTSLSKLGLLHSVQSFGRIGSKLVTYNFIHLTVQDLLAAYYISQMEPDEHSIQFETLLKEGRLLSTLVLPFYAGLTRLTVESVRNLFLRIYISRWYTLPILNCIFEAQICDQLFFERLLYSLQFQVYFTGNLLYRPIMDHQSILYFLFSIRNMVKGQLCLNLSYCSDDSLAILLANFPEHMHAGTSSTSDILAPVQKLILNNGYTDSGIPYIARALESNNTLKSLTVGTGNVTDMGLVPLLEALPRQHSLEKLRLIWTLSHPVESLKKIGECVGRSRMEELELEPYSPSLQSEEAVKEWLQSVMVGGKSLLQSFSHYQEKCSLQMFCQCHCQVDKFRIESQLYSFFGETLVTINKDRSKKSLPMFCFVINFLSL